MKKFLFSVLIITLILSACEKDEAQKIFEKARVSWDNNHYDEAIQNFIALTKAFPDHELVDDSLFWIANIYEHYLNDKVEAIRYYRYFNKSFKDSEYYYDAMTSLARLYASQTDPEAKRRAKLIYNKIQTTNLTDNEWDSNQFKIAQIHFNLKEYEQARIELKKLLLKHPQTSFFAKAYNLIGFSYYAERKLELAEIAYQEALKKNNSSEKSLQIKINLAGIYEETDQLTLAIQIYEGLIHQFNKKDYWYEILQNRLYRIKTRLIKTKD